MSRSHVRGFTLVELLVVIVIILMVSVVVLPTLVATLGERGRERGNPVPGCPGRGPGRGDRIQGSGRDPPAG